MKEIFKFIYNFYKISYTFIALAFLFAVWALVELLASIGILENLNPKMKEVENKLYEKSTSN